MLRGLQLKILNRMENYTSGTFLNSERVNLFLVVSEIALGVGDRVKKIPRAGVITPVANSFLVWMENCARACHNLIGIVYNYFRLVTKLPCFIKLFPRQGNSYRQILLPIKKCICGIHCVQSKMRSGVWTVWAR
jgi:hypothetical protein